MAYTREQIQQLFQSSFDLTKWTDVIINFFKAREVNRVPVPLDIAPSEGKGYELGYLDTSDTYRIGFFYLKLDRSIDNRKVGLRQMIAKYIKIDADAGIGVFDDGNHWRLSFITDLKAEKTSPKRYTFVFGDGENGYRTAVDRFMDLQRKGISFANIKEAFSVEALTKQFYNDLFDWYTWALKEDTGVYFPNNPNTPADDRENLDTKMIRLITRLMFVWFIKQKGLVPDALFNPEEVDHWLKDFDAQSMESANYYQAILQNLFFATLNRPIKTISYDKDGNEQVERRGFAHLQGKQDVKSLYRYEELFKIDKDKILSIFEFIPFINGGLFECLDKNKTSDGVDHAYFEDGFSRNSTIKDGRWTKRAFVPNKLFFDPEDGIISIFNRYNFTVEENSPSEQQVALDPELLGKVFENLLGVYNPETHDTARSQSGSFYTPREIVNYMVDRSLEAYLGNTDEVKLLFRDDFDYDESKRAFYNEVIAKLKAIKVLDPACGSGAFPIGMLNRIVEIMQNLNASGNKYDQKLEIMENCIYGGDIQAIAAQITKLRFFISLVCDCKKTDNPDDNYGIPNLPNLETHFVTCDSLIGLKKPQQYSLFEQDIIALKEKLKEVRHEHFTTKTVYQKTKLRNRDKELRDELAKMLSDDSVIASEDATQMAAWNPYDQNGKSPFFDPEWMFGIKDGFDVVIGNPPYIQLQENEGRLGNLYEPCGYETFTRMGDMYMLFYERGINLLKKEGYLCYITKNQWMTVASGEALRDYFANKTNPLLLLNFSGVKIFESATVDTHILLLSKNKNQGKTCASVLNKSNKNQLNSLETFVSEHSHLMDYNTADKWVILTDIEYDIQDKIYKNTHPIEDWNVIIYRGILTGNNDAFIIDTAAKDQILANCEDQAEKERTEKVLRPIVRGKDILRYGYNWAGKWLVAMYPAKDYNIDSYPAIRNYLQSFAYTALCEDNNFDIANNHLADYCKQKLMQAGKEIVINGKPVTNSRGQKDKSRKRTGNKWFETQDQISFWKEFDKPKILWKRIGSILRFSYDDTGILGLDSTCLATGDHLEVLCCILNSKLGHYLLKDSPRTGTGDLLISVQAVEPLLVPTPTVSQESDLIALLHAQMQGVTDENDAAIANIVYEMYGINDSEMRNYIDNYEL